MRQQFWELVWLLALIVTLPLLPFIWAMGWTQTDTEEDNENE